MAKSSITIAVTVPSDLEKDFETLIGKIRKNVIRQSVRAAILPARTALRAVLMGLSSESIQSTGASMRAVDTKVKQSKSNPNKFYGIVGVSKKYIEALVPEASPKYKRTIQRQLSFGVFTGVKRKTGKPIYAKKFKRGDVRNRAGRRWGLRKRIPNKYWHLSERGFKHAKSGYMFPGHNFVGKVTDKTKSESVRIFEETFRRHMKRVMS
jgi:hypothetical protein